MEQEGPGSLLARKAESFLGILSTGPPDSLYKSGLVNMKEEVRAVQSDQDAEPSSATLEPSTSSSEIGGDDKSYLIRLLKDQYGNTG